MRLCLMIEGQEGVTWQDWLTIVSAVEGSGLEGLFRSDHYLSMDGLPGKPAMDAWAILAGLASHTERIRLGTLVSPVTFRHPSVLASMVATVDHISGGRIELGLGAGWYGLEHEVFGIDFPPPRTRLGLFEEQIEIIYRQWTEDGVTFSGQYFNLDSCTALPKPVQQPPPLIVGGSGKPRTVRAAVRFATEYNTTLFQPEQCREVRSALDQECIRQGRDPSSLRLSVLAENAVIGTSIDDVAQKVERIRRELSTESPGALISGDLTSWFVGTTDEIVERLAGLAEAGADRVMLQHQLFRDLESITLIDEEVLPHLTHL